MVLLSAGALKCADPVLAALAVDAYDLLPPALALGVGLFLPGLEVAVGAALVTDFLARGAALLAAVLALGFLLFTVVRVGWPTIALDVALLLAAAGLLRAPR